MVARLAVAVEEADKRWFSIPRAVLGSVVVEANGATGVCVGAAATRPDKVAVVGAAVECDFDSS